MKCTIDSIRNIELKNKRVGSRIEGFVSGVGDIPEEICDWIKSYQGVKAIVYEDGIYIASWGETTCSNNDKYESVTGKHIAESRAKAKIYRFMRNLSEYLSNYYMSKSNYFQDDYLKYEHCVEHEDEHTNYLIYGEQESI